MQTATTSEATKLAEQEVRAVERAVNFAQGRQRRTMREAFEWLEMSVEAAMNHVVRA